MNDFKKLKKCIGKECCDFCYKVLKNSRGASLDVWGFKKDPITIVLIFCSEECSKKYKKKNWSVK